MINKIAIKIVGTNDAKIFDTIGGTLAGIFIVKFLRLISKYNLADTKPTIIAENTPWAPNQVAGIAVTPSVVVSSGVIIKKHNNEIILADIPSSSGSNLFTNCYAINTTTYSDIAPIVILFIFRNIGE